MTRKQTRLALIAGFIGIIGLALTLILMALRDQIVFFYSPSEIKQKAVASGTPIRLGGLVKQNSCERNGQMTAFIVTDGESDMQVAYVGLLPDLFRSGQGVVVEGAMNAAGAFDTTKVMAKHDENYMPKEVVEALKARGEWQRDATIEIAADDNCAPDNLAATAGT